MKGWLMKRRKGRHFADTVILRTGVKVDEAGRRRPQEKWIPIGTCTKQQADGKLTELLSQVQRNEFVPPSDLSLGEWLRRWWAESIKPSKARGTVTSYKSIIDAHLVPFELSPGCTLGSVPLQALRSGHLKQYYATKTGLSRSTLAVHHSILFSALSAAVADGLVTRNVAALVPKGSKPRAERRDEDLAQHCWSAEEARAFLAAAKDASVQEHALYRLALSTGMRKGELLGLKWTDVDLTTANKVKVLRTLLVAGRDPVFGPPKGGRPRTIDLGPDTVRVLAEHKRTQAELNMANRTRYRDLPPSAQGLVFANADPGSTAFGQPLNIGNIGQRSFAAVIKAAGGRTIRFHDLRHTAATLMLQSGEPIKVVSERLGHSKVEITLNIYCHALPSMQQGAASRLDALLGGGGAR
jgi:integrase